MPYLTKQAKKDLLITAGIGAIDVLKTFIIDSTTRRAIKRMEIALAANGYVYKEGETKKLQLPVFNYHVEYCGGSGPNVWDDEMLVEGVHNLAEAYAAAMIEVDKVNGWITLIEQKD